MDFVALDLLWLLLPLAAASGWYAARRDHVGKPDTRDDRLSSDYFRGVNYLLNEQPDKAIEVFTRMLEVNTDTVETHLALGSLFRRRGEVERAIRIHQNLIARPTLDRSQRAQALCELAIDYLKAGLLDRAENLFLELAETGAHTEQALRSLMHIYEQEKDWDKALAVGRRLAQNSGRQDNVVLAQYCCELAEQAMKDGAPVRARHLVDEAMALDARCARASLLAGRLAAAEGKDRVAIAAWQKIEQQDAVLLDEAIGEIVDAYRRLGDDSGLHAYLHELARRRPGNRALKLIVQAIRERDGDAAGQAFLAGYLRDQPSIPGLKCLVDLRLVPGAGGEKGDLALLKTALDHLAAEQQGYQCRQCGFRGHVLDWQCPACHGWVTIKPLSSLLSRGNGEATAVDFALESGGKKRS
jgi:lipopolysaccharide biosynthesis regulator YciM